MFRGIPPSVEVYDELLQCVEDIVLVGAALGPLGQLLRILLDLLAESYQKSVVRSESVRS